MFSTRSAVNITPGRRGLVTFNGEGYFRLSVTAPECCSGAEAMGLG